VGEEAEEEKDAEDGRSRRAAAAARRRVYSKQSKRRRNSDKEEQRKCSKCLSARRAGDTAIDQALTLKSEKKKVESIPGVGSPCGP
jgi:hypothetical protein